MTRTVVLDVETTGLDPACDRIVEVACLDTTGEHYSRLINPGRSVGESGAIHGITDDMLSGELTFAEVAHTLDVLVGDAICVAYNARFDRAFLIAEYLRAGLDAPRWLRRDTHWIDPLVWARIRDPYVRGGHKLATVADRLGVPRGTAHRALGDCETTAGVLAALAPTMPEDFDELIMKQRIAAADNEASFLRWIAKQPKREVAA